MGLRASGCPVDGPGGSRRRSPIRAPTPAMRSFPDRRPWGRKLLHLPVDWNVGYATCGRILDGDPA